MICLMMTDGGRLFLLLRMVTIDGASSFCVDRNYFSGATFAFIFLPNVRFVDTLRRALEIRSLAESDDL